MHIELDQEGLRHHAKRAGIDLDAIGGSSQFSRKIGTAQSTVTRILKDETHPGARFIAGTMGLFGCAAFSDCFRAVQD